MTTSRVPSPPSIPGIPEARIRDGARIWAWTAGGLLYGMLHGPFLGRLGSSVLAVLWIAAAPLGIVLQSAMIGRPWARYYLIPEKDAVLGIVARADGWEVTDHVASAPGKGRGAALRTRLLPELTARADALQVPVYANAATKGLADRYRVEVPGMDDVGRAWPRGRKLRRKPNGA